MCRKALYYKGLCVILGRTQLPIINYFVRIYIFNLFLSMLYCLISIYSLFLFVPLQERLLRMCEKLY